MKENKHFIWAISIIIIVILLCITIGFISNRYSVKSFTVEIAEFNFYDAETNVSIKICGVFVIYDIDEASWRPTKPCPSNPVPSNIGVKK